MFTKSSSFKRYESIARFEMSSWLVEINENMKKIRLKMVCAFIDSWDEETWEVETYGRNFPLQSWKLLKRLFKML